MFTALFRRMGGSTRQEREPAAVHPAAAAAAAPAADVPEIKRLDNDMIVMRQAILRRDLNVAGFEFARRSDGETDGGGLQRDRALVHYALGAEARGIVGRRMTFFPIAEELLFDPLIEGIPQLGPIPLVRVGSAGRNPAALVERIAALKRKGIAVGLADGNAALENGALASVVSIAFFPVSNIAPPDLAGLVRRLSAKHPMLQLGARGLQSHEEFEACDRLGFKYFQGPFITRREDWGNNRVAPTTLKVSALLERMRNGADAPEIAEKIRLDPMLSLRILRFANSASFGLSRETVSIKHALVVIGRDALYRWLVLLLYSTASARPGYQAVLETALARARLMESVAPAGGPAAVRENLFLTGMFSLLDVMLQVNAQALLEHLVLSGDVRDAILGYRGPCALPLQFAEACESGHARIEEFSGQLGIDAATLNRLQAGAARWAIESVQEMFG